LEEIAAHYASESTTVADAGEAIDFALSKALPDDVIFITGSLYLVGQLRHYLRRKVLLAAAAAEKG
jgi:folylpolyglutamate synthase/dihydropteroate synthase